MELSIDQALQKGIEAHKSGKVQEADRYYTAILKANPKHSDANHNMGVLSVGVGQVDGALPFFKTALEENPSIAQYWLSYIDALVKLDRLDQAKSMLDQAKDKGATGEGFDQLEQRLKLLGEELPSIVSKENKVQDPPQDQLQPLFNFYNEGQLQQALDEASRLLKQFTNSVALYNICGAANRGLGQLDAAIDAYNKALTIKPDYGPVLFNLGNALKDMGRDSEALNFYEKALLIMPRSPDIFMNMGIVLRRQEKLVGSIDAFKKAIEIKPAFPEALNNMGIAIRRQGKLEEAVKVYKKALVFNPNYSDAYNNLGNALQDQSKLDEAIVAYEKAFYLKPNSSDALWNLVGTSNNISEATRWLERCVSIDPNHLKAKLTLLAVQFYSGEKTSLDKLISSPLKEHSFIRSFAWVFSFSKRPELYFNRWAFFDYAISVSRQERPFYEFGVWRGEAFKYLIKTLKRGFGFDTFEGLPEDWHHESAGTYSSNGNIPEIEGGEFIVGNFDVTLEPFFSIPRPMASIINFDADLYSSTLCALNFSKPVIDQHTILIFDEFIMNENWENDEYKALIEFCENNGCGYELLAISFTTKQAAFRLINI